jgi:Fe-S oxidoreductase
MNVVRGGEYASLTGSIHMGKASLMEKYGQRVLDRLNKKVVYHANCATRWIPEYDNFLDEVFGLIGVERPRSQYERLNALCCSVPVLFTNKELALDIQKKNLEDAIACGADGA